MEKMRRDLRRLVREESLLFALTDLRALLPRHREGAFKSVVTRLEKRGELLRVCRGIYLFPGFSSYNGDMLGNVAARLRAHHFNYLSLETVLSAAGVISQIPVNRITVMSSGRSNVISCGVYGSIEFVHTRKTPTELAAHLAYDSGSQLWRASVPQALQDMRDTRRDTGLVDWESAGEFV